jgi:hypothetical protein
VALLAVITMIAVAAIMAGVMIIIVVHLHVITIETVGPHIVAVVMTTLVVLIVTLRAAKPVIPERTAVAVEAEASTTAETVVVMEAEMEVEMAVVMAVAMALVVTLVVMLALVATVPASRHTTPASLTEVEFMKTPTIGIPVDRFGQLMSSGAERPSK